MNWSTRRRFYERVTAVAVPEGFVIALDGRPVRTPGGAPLAVASEPLAAVLAAEWDAQEQEIRPHTMPVTRIVGSGLDAVAADPGRFVDKALAYGETDLLCYRAGSPPDLVERERSSWDPLLDWLSARFAATLAVAAGVVPRAQPTESLARLRAHVASLDPVRLSALNSLVAACGSLVLGLAVAEGRLTAEEGFALSQVDEAYQMEKWGTDAEALEKRAGLEAEARAAALVLRLAGGQSTC